ncbi:putative retrotransposon hot spot protein (RHS) [Trypanosoma cruzi]|nr:putative retrotransposon hot spot protein (RHS) [Trypanosoma cruzi]
MSGRPSKGIHGNEEGQASTVPQGDSLKRAMSDLEGDTAQPAATPIRVEEAQLQWTMCSTVWDILLDGETDISDMKLNAFLREHFGSRAAVEEEQNVDMWDFLRSPDAFIKDQQLLEEISNLKDYQLLRDRRKLADGHLNYLEDWIEFEEKDTVTPLTRKKLNDALTQIQKEVARWEAEERAKRMAEEDVRQNTEEKTTKLEGFYESVYGAKWGHVLGFYDDKICEDRMEVHEGKPPQSWTYKKEGLTFEKDDGVEQFRPPRPRLMVLTSDKGWPYSWRENKPIVDCYVNCEVDRVWQIVERDIEDLSDGFGGYDPTLRQRVLVGTPGIGKSMNAGSYLLYQLLHCDAEKIQVVVHCFGEGEAYVFDKTTKTVTKYVGIGESVSVVLSLSQRGMKGYIIYDVPTNGPQLPISFAPSTGWGTIGLASPKVRDIQEFARQRDPHRIIMNYPEEMDVKAMCAWMKRDGTPQFPVSLTTKTREDAIPDSAHTELLCFIPPPFFFFSLFLCSRRAVLQPSDAHAHTHTHTNTRATMETCCSRSKQFERRIENGTIKITFRLSARFPPPTPPIPAIVVVFLSCATAPT